MIQDVTRDVKNKKEGFFITLFNFLLLYLISGNARILLGFSLLHIIKRRKGKRGIRTLGTINSYNGLAIQRFSPLSHLS